MKLKTCGLLVMALCTSLVVSPASAQGRGGRGGGFALGGPGGFGGGSATGLLRIAEVQKELKLDPAQIELLEQLNQEGDEKRRSLFTGVRDLPEDQRRARFEQMRAQMEKMNADQEKQANDILNAQQRTRLRQLSIQRAGNSALSRKDVQDELKMTSDQRAKVEAIQRETGEAARGVFNFQPGQPPNPEQFEAGRKKMEQIRTAADARLLAVLSPAQQQQFKGMGGAPFTFPQPQFGRGPGGGGGGAPRRRPNP